MISATDYYNEKTVYSNAITVNKADSKFTATVKKDGTETSNFTYGDTITVEVSGIQVKMPTGRNALSQDYAYLFATAPGNSPDASSAIANAAISNGKATLTYDTSGKGVEIGNGKTLWIAYGGSDGFNPVTQTVSMELAVKPLTAVVNSGDSSAAKIYDGNTNFSDVKLTLSGTVGGDTVAATATGTANDSNVGESKAFTAASVTLGGAVKVWYSLATGGVSGNVKITKAAGAAISTVTGSYTGDGSTFTYTVTPIAGAEYSKDNSTWQDSNVFTGFTTTSGATTFYARMKADNNHNAGASSNTGAVTFSKLEKAENPALSYQISGATGSKQITITVVSGCEYTFDDGASWGSTNTHTFTTDGQPVIGIRFAETATHNASAGAKQTVDLTNQEQSAPGAFTLTFTDNGDGIFTATIPTVSGGEYSFDGSNWSGTNTKSDCQPNTSYTGYVRLAAKDGYNASPATTDTRTTPKLIVADPVITPNGGSFNGSQSVSIATATSDARIYYTTDGSAPSSASTAYTGAFTLTGSATVQAIALKDGYESSGVIKAVFTKQSNSGGTGGSSGSGDNTPSYTPPTVDTPPATPEQPNPPTNGSTTLPGKPDKDGNVSVTVPDKNITDAINAAKKQAGENGISVTVEIQLTQTANSLTATLSKAALDKLIAAEIKELEISSGLIRFSFNLEALKEIQKSVAGSLTITAKRMDGKTLSTAAQTVIGSRPVFDFTMQSGGKAITGFGKGSASVWMPYTPTKSEAEGGLQAVYVDAKGGVEWITGSSYNADAKALLFSTDHFSIYGVGYKQDVPKFTDITDHWAKADIEFAAARGLLSGTGNNQFTPNASMTRGMFVTALGRLAGADVSGYTASSFSDVATGSYYLGYIEWASKNGIVNGVGDGRFAPDQSISREQMAVIMQNYAKSIGFELPKAHAQNTFADNGKIGAWAADAVKAMQMAGVLSGKNGNMFDPQGTATRAEVSALLHRFVELIIDSSSAQGWMQNDSGRWMYYENGKPVIGKRDIGGNTYSFDQYGETANLPKNLTYGSYTVKKGDNFWKIAREQNCNIYELVRVNGKTIFSIIYEGEVLKIPPNG